MARNVQVLLVENVDGTGIVGDVVQVRKGFARNFLLPRGIATTPDENKIKDLQVKRKDAIKQLGELKKARTALIEKLKGHELTMIRSCNDLGILYGAVTQHEIAVELAKAGFKGIIDREVRIALPIKRIGDYGVTVKFSEIQVPDDSAGQAKPTTRAAKRDEVSLEAEVKIHVKPDRELDIEKGKADAAAAETATIEKQAKDKGATFTKDKPADASAPAAAPAKAEAPAKAAGKPGSGVKAPAKKA
ncbi:MAG: 50S ribosomal protein L9 [Phycisphaerales bacterium]|jgi:large subunit ribosomal protein L9|nr:50S ribosomal protein L9 [Phycisphaerales bacterium]